MTVNTSHLTIAVALRIPARIMSPFIKAGLQMQEIPLKMSYL